MDLAYPGRPDGLHAALLVSKVLEHLTAYLEAGRPRSALLGLVLLLEQLGEADPVDALIRAQARRLATALERSSPGSAPLAPDGREPLVPGPVPQAAVDSGHLLQGSRELHISHRGEIYQLRLTKQDKLILTK